MTNSIHGNRKLIQFYENEIGCLICTSHSTWKGYPLLSINNKATRMSRFIYEECFGLIPEGLYICHTCDNPGCINPAHLYAGTNLDNVKDKIERGHHLYGEQHPCAKLTEIDIIKIRQSNQNINQLSQEFAVSKAHIWKIRSKRKWKHL